MENTVSTASGNAVASGNNLPTIEFRKRYNLKIKVYRYDNEKTIKLLRANQYAVSFFIEEQTKVSTITVYNVSICGATIIRNLIKHIMIYD